MLDANYITGLVDGEGGFTVYIKDRNESRERKRRARIEPKFYIKLNHRDKDILYELKKFFGCGNVYLQKDNRPTHKDCYRFEVTHRHDLSDKIIPFFKKHQLRLSSKINDFRIFCEIIEAIMNQEHSSEQGLDKLRSLKRKMH